MIFYFDLGRIIEIDPRIKDADVSYLQNILNGVKTTNTMLNFKELEDKPLSGIWNTSEAHYKKVINYLKERDYYKSFLIV